MLLKIKYSKFIHFFPLMSLLLTFSCVEVAQKRQAACKKNSVDEKCEQGIKQRVVVQDQSSSPEPEKPPGTFTSDEVLALINNVIEKFNLGLSSSEDIQEVTETTEVT